MTSDSAASTTNKAPCALPVPGANFGVDFPELAPEAGVEDVDVLEHGLEVGVPGEEIRFFLASGGRGLPLMVASEERFKPPGSYRRQGLLPLRQPGTKQETIHTYFSVVTDPVVTDPQWGCWNLGISELVKERNQWIRSFHQKWITFRGGLHFEIHD